MAVDDLEALLPADAAAGEPGQYDLDLVTGDASLSAHGCRLLGFTESRRLALKDLRARCHPADRQRVADEIAAAFAQPARGLLRARFRIRRDDGSVTWVEVRGRIERDEAGRAVRTTGIVHAVTGRKPVDRPPDQGWGQLESALANSSVVVFQQDLALRYTWIHDPRLGLAAQSMLGRTDAELSGPEPVRPIDDIKRQVIATGKPARAEVTMQGRGSPGRFELYVEPRRDETGAVVGVTCVAIELAAAEGGVGETSGSRRAFGDRGAFLERIEIRNDGGGMAERGLFTVCVDVLRRKLGGYAALSPQDAALLGLLQKRRRFVPARQKLAVAKNAAPLSCLIGTGWVFSYAVLSSGERQVMGFHVPGDLIGGGGHGVTGGCSYVAVTDCVVCEFDRGTVAKLRASETRLPEALQWADAREHAILQQHLISIGRRSARARVAHLLLELGHRLKLVGLANDHGYACPLSQELIGDALGLTKIHVNRMLRELRELECLTFRNGYVSFGDVAKLTALAEFDPGYLDVRVTAPATRGRSRE